MADIAGRRLNESASPAVASDMTQSRPLPSPGASRRNSLSDQNAAQHAPWNTSSKAPSTQSTSPVPPGPPGPPGTTPTTTQYRQFVPNQESLHVQSVHGPSGAPPPPPPPAALQLRSNGLPHPHGQHLPGQPPPNTMNIYPSPTLHQSQLSATSQYNDLRQLISRTEPSIVRQVIRDSHESCLLGSEYHLSFLFNTAIHRAKTSTLKQSIAEFGPKLVKTSSHQIVTHFDANDIDQVSDAILAKASSAFLDRALAKRLETIRARSLVNALAKAERLGYDVKDVVEEKRDGSEYVVPHMQQELAQHPSQHHPPPQQPPRAEPPATASQPAVKSSSKSHNFMSCNTCARPCSGAHALRYHKMKSACNNFKTFDRVGRSICAHCGTEFTSSGGLGYHAKSQVCGNYTDQHMLDIMPVLRDFYRGRPRLPVSSSQSHDSRSIPTAPVAPATVATMSTGKGKVQDPYAHLLPEQKERLEADLAEAEAHYGQLMQKASELPEPRREEELAKLRNSFNTKQSTTRKKYGVKLRERRTRAEIDAERERLLKASSKHKSAHAEQLHTPQSGSMPAVKRARSNGEGDSAPTVQPDGPSPADDSPRKRVALADMGGLGTSAATAEHTAPTALSPPKSYMSAYQQSKSWPANMPQAGVSKTVAESRADGGPNDPMQVDESSENDDSDSEEEEDDIPATLPHRHQ